MFGKCYGSCLKIVDDTNNPFPYHYAADDTSRENSKLQHLFALSRFCCIIYGLGWPTKYINSLLLLIRSFISLCVYVSKYCQNIFSLSYFSLSPHILVMEQVTHPFRFIFYVIPNEKKLTNIKCFWYPCSGVSFLTLDGLSSFVDCFCCLDKMIST